MSLHATPARSSRITKSRRTSASAALGLKRALSSPLSSAGPHKRLSLPSSNSMSHDHDEQLDDTGIIASLADNLNFRDVPQYMEYIRNRMFSIMPHKSGMNSTRISQVLNFHLRLPPFVTISHVDALSTSSTKVEREIAELAQAGIVRRLTIPNRGVGPAAIGDGIALVKEWQSLVRAHEGLPEYLKDKYVSLMDANPTSSSISGATFTPFEISSLSTAGFLTSSTAGNTNPSIFASPGTPSLSSISTSGSRHAAGTLHAVGGVSGTHHMHGGTSLSSRPLSSSTLYNFSLPNTGAYTKLLGEARTHFLNMLRKTKFKESPLDVLRERWDGGVENGDKRAARGEFKGQLPGRTKKWKQFYGMRFEWILEECVGAGLVEIFETGSVGRAVRLTA